MFKKINIFLITLCSIFTFNNTCYAKVTPYTTKENIKDCTLIRIPLEKDDGSIIYIPSDKFFASGNEGYSHQFFLNQSLNILKNDKGDKVFNLLEPYKKTIMSFSDKPDKDEKDYGFAYHFYNPYTGRNYLPKYINASYETGLVRFENHTKNALQNYKNNRSYSMEELGRACHFLEDINVPHHSANLVAVLSTHSQYEDFINERNQDYVVSTSDKYNEFSSLSFENYCTQLFQDCAKHSYKYKDLANAKKGLKGDTEKWNIAAKETTKYLQEHLSAFFYRFLKEVEEF
ncbi:zinc dependent phospholipase C family protein [Clostridium rectalis]|uniref:zinc dependent phospholipase C family protein n=1 Tax=Clostridium rectalis TaxID=2040295 RepID=UPI0013DE6605|nr:zinc dependent phospholipase C family protein [Clostridium rectalis]